jgi:hypothetical protein
VGALSPFGEDHGNPRPAVTTAESCSRFRRPVLTTFKTHYRRLHTDGCSCWRGTRNKANAPGSRDHCVTDPIYVDADPRVGQSVQVCGREPERRSESWSSSLRI